MGKKELRHTECKLTVVSDLVLAHTPPPGIRTVGQTGCTSPCCPHHRLPHKRPDLRRRRPRAEWLRQLLRSVSWPSGHGGRGQPVYPPVRGIQESRSEGSATRPVSGRCRPSCASAHLPLRISALLGPAALPPGEAFAFGNSHLFCGVRTGLMDFDIFGSPRLQTRWPLARTGCALCTAQCRFVC